MFAWVGIPALFAGVTHLAYLAAPGSTHLVTGMCLGAVFVFLAAGVILVRQWLRPRQSWVAPVYAAVMLVLTLPAAGLVRVATAELLRQWTVVDR